MSKQLFETLLAKFKRSNNVRKQKLAEEAGFKTSEDYQKYLENQVKSTIEELPLTSEQSLEKPIVHVIDIIDCSSSMQGSKLSSAISGLNEGVKNLKTEYRVNYTHSLCTFSSSNTEKFVHKNKPVQDINETFSFGASGTTALYDAIGFSINEAKLFSKNDKVLINIYTDGEENTSLNFSSFSLKELIDSVKDNFTVTFIGTARDVQSMITTLGIDSSNTLVYDGTGEGLRKGLDKTFQARTNYTTSLINNEDVSKGFYKKLNN